jgi:hypothetical protein
MKLGLILLFILETLSLTYGQSVVPLSIGNKWIYSINGHSNQINIYEVVSDTIISGQKFCKIKYTSGTYTAYEYWRADSNQFYINSSFPFASGVKYDRDSTKWKAENIESSYMYFLNFKNRKVQKAYNHYVMTQHIWSYTYITSQDFGLVEIYSEYTDEVQGNSSNSTALIRGAVINGTVYGDTTMPPPPPPKPAAPKLTAVAGNNLIELQWSKFEENDFLEYNLFETNNSIDSLIYTTKNINDTTLIINGLTNGKVYDFKINAINLNNDTSNFSEIAATPNLYTKALNIKGDFTPDFDNSGFNGIVNQQGLNYILYKNNSGTFIETDSFPALAYGNISWADFNNDGYYDLFYCGEDYNNYYGVSKIFKNNFGKFNEINADITGVVSGSIDWADYDNDGDLDFILTGDPFDPYDSGNRDPQLPTVRITELYRNDGNGIFTLVNSDFPGIIWGSAVWGDYDNDGSEDLLLCGLDFIKIYRNVKGSFKEAFSFKGYDNSGAWGDFNNDGLLDFCVISADTFNVNQNNAKLKVFKNNGDNTFSEYTIASSLKYTAIKVRDYDNDGDLDIILPYLNTIFQNNGDFNFKRISVPASESYADYDNDGDLDVTDHYGEGIFRNNQIFNQSFNAKKKLNPPINLSEEVQPDHSVKFSWDRPELNYPTQILSYNLRIGSESNGIDILSPMSNLITGKRLKLAIGNAGFDTFKIINDLPEGTYYWNVQSVDNNFNVSVFSKEQRITVNYIENEIPAKFSLNQNFPNPFNPSTKIKYSIPKAENVTLKIYDILGRQIKTLVNEEKPAGNYSIEFNGKDMPSGVYFYQIRAGVFTETRKMLLLK